jgi:hypothetical protein
MADAATKEKDAAAKADADYKAAVEKVAKDKAAGKDTFSMAGVAGGPYQITGEGFTGSKGTVALNGAQLEVTKWTDKDIRGQLPGNAKKGAVEVNNGEETQSGVWPTPAVPPAVTVIQVTTEPGKAPVATTTTTAAKA